LVDPIVPLSDLAAGCKEETMYRLLLLLVGVALLITPITSLGQTQTFNLQLNTNLLNMMPPATTTDPPGNFKNVIPGQFDPAKTYLVQAAWLNGIGCPLNAIIANPNSDFAGVQSTGNYSDMACPTGDPNDKQNAGLLLAKTGPTNNFASATAELVNVKGITLTEIGYDIRKPMSTADPRGSHCGAGSPRFDIVTTDGNVHFIGCNSPPPVQTASSTGWIRLRWTAADAIPPVVTPVQRIVIVMDEGQDPSGGPDQFGVAILDNIDVNTQLVGTGPVNAK
jgi:hypothetical protein